MRNGLPLLMMLLAIPAAAPSRAEQQELVCRQPSVIDEIRREVRDHDYYSKIDPRLVTETPTATPDVVMCQVCVLSAPFNVTRFGEQPIKQCLEHGFEVRILRGGFVVRDLQ